MGDYLVPAIALMLVLEGLLPLVAPRAWKGVFRQMIEMRDGQVRFIGLMSIVVGGVLIMVVSR
jgi:uncharacterized protein YjeT (DUF2065 family)